MSAHQAFTTPPTLRLVGPTDQAQVTLLISRTELLAIVQCAAAHARCDGMRHTADRLDRDALLLKRLFALPEVDIQLQVAPS